MAKPKSNYYSGDMEATVPTPPDQQDVNALDMVGEAVEEGVDTFRDDIGLKDEKMKNKGGEQTGGNPSKR
ncbi:hypothetical protein E5161_10175 [Cohnella pontilimi]|uniref:Uncharacterized protein n=1 Tax=Cohnella pontilimi TaxID=2564100 RepID=A0A4U0FBW7_9BACL|nr:hypothetical protein [Cohnella pontilimi]TJY42353.1 hypothetical protein E5161_10175 [Cohnella pontilimi]